MDDRLEALRAELRALYRQRRDAECCVADEIIDRIDAIAAEIAEILNRQCGAVLGDDDPAHRYPGPISAGRVARR